MATDNGIRVEDIKSKISSEAMAPTHDDIIRAFGEKVLSEPIPWEGYCNAGLIHTNELNLIKKYDKCSREARVQLFQKVVNNFLLFGFYKKEFSRFSKLIFLFSQLIISTGVRHLRRIVYGIVGKVEQRNNSSISFDFNGSTIHRYLINSMAACI
jgi:hypothetical protein